MNGDASFKQRNASATLVKHLTVANYAVPNASGVVLQLHNLVLVSQLACTQCVT